jgi:hypothetical protein
MPDMRPATSPYLVTEPRPHERCFEMSVRDVPHRHTERYHLYPWLRITANSVTEEITIAAGIKAEFVKHTLHEEDGA